MSDALVNGLAGACGGMIAQLLTYPLQAVNTRQQVRRNLLSTAEQVTTHRTADAATAAQLRESNADGDEDENGDSYGAVDNTGRSAVHPLTAASTLTSAATGSHPRLRLRSQALSPDAASLSKQGGGSSSSTRGRSSGEQTQRKASGRGASVADTAKEMWEIVREEGIGALYRGLKPSLVGTACSQGVYYYFYQLFRDRAEKLALRRLQAGKGNGQVGVMTSLLVAAMAGCLNVLLTNPIWVVVTRMQTQSRACANRPPVVKVAVDTSSASEIVGSSDRSRYGAACPPSSCSSSSGCGTGGVNGGEGGSVTRLAASVTRRKRDHEGAPLGAIATTVELFEEAGLPGFWKGVLPTLIMVSNPALQFAIYETLLARITANRPRGGGGVKSASALEIFLVGAVAKLGATVVTYPLLVVKARLQARQNDPHARYSGTLNALARIVMEEGVLGLYRGMDTKILQSVFASSVLFLTKEELVKLVRALVLQRQQALLLAAASLSRQASSRQPGTA